VASFWSAMKEKMSRESEGKMIKAPSVQAPTSRENSNPKFQAQDATSKGIAESLAQIPSAEPQETDRLPEGYQRKR